MRLREVVQPLISKARGTQCENCLSRRQLQVTCVIPLEVLAAQFDAENADQEFDQVRSPRFVVFSLHPYESSPGEAVGGRFFFDFE